MQGNRLTYLQARILLLILGMGLAVTQTLLAWERGAPPTEVLAPALLVPVFAGAILAYLPGGLAAATLSSLIYGVVLSDTVSAVGMRLFVVQLIVRVFQYYFYAVIISLGARYVEGRLRKLELYDQLDDLTELYNSAFFLEDADLEVSRSNRYRTLFSVSELVVDREAFTGFSRRRYRKAIRELAQRVQNAVRKMDRAARVDGGDKDMFLIMLPETAREGASIFTGRLEIEAREYLTTMGCVVDARVRSRAIAYPDDPDDLATLRQEVAELDLQRRALKADSEEAQA